MSESEIRQATPYDLPAIVALADALAREDGGQRDPFANAGWVEAEGAARFAEVIGDSTAACFVAVVGGEVLGFVSGRLEPANTFSLVPGARIGSLFVRPPFRGRDIGERLTAAFLDWARANGAVRVTVSAYAANAGAIRFYERHGFAPLTVTLQLVC